MYDVLVPVDDNDTYATKQVDTLRSLPNHDELSVTVLHVFEGLDRGAETLGTAFVDDLEEQIAREPPETFETTLEALEDAGIDAQGKQMVGDPVDGILEAADEIDADAILLGGRKRSSVGKLLFGSTSQRVIIDADRVIILAD